ncbi:MAG: bifunctional diaminohydroxyphosphoribosylaminopyrimidine deaminase/5-amino-6-(5-phosphoribosylamino)uracil reductase RibD [Acidobacteria bacterium]|nr:MAG: bifunctional diaminohydroxyphosphoribosylaminopyrimidine deaminase/5-amino-6-(5-phosphoribosylamino)uracil reductase RibD [Acidobacteriota bacterium]
MERALELARLGAHSAHPNPMVGAVVVADGAIVGEGWHVAPGTPHAEVVALRNAAERARGATLYVTLEPCAHTGRTPPCIDAIAEAGVSAVRYAIADPDPSVAGGGAKLLAESGVDVSGGMLASEATELNAAYLIHRVQGRPRITYKAAMTIDGRTAAVDGSSKWISGPESREMVQQLRAEADAIMVGSGTILADDPSLNCRLKGFAGTPPVRVIVDSAGRLPAGARAADESAPTWVLTSSQGESALRSRFGDSLELIALSDGSGQLDLGEAMARLAQRGIVELLCEGGASLAGALLDRDLLDRCIFFVAPAVAGGSAGSPLFGGNSASTIADVTKMDFQSVARVGDDLMIVVDPRPGAGRGTDGETHRS